MTAKFHYSTLFPKVYKLKVYFPEVTRIFTYNTIILANYSVQYTQIELASYSYGNIAIAQKVLYSIELGIEVKYSDAHC